MTSGTAMPGNIGDQEALVDSKYRLTWAEAKKLGGRHGHLVGGNGNPQGLPHHHSVPQQRLWVFGTDRLRAGRLHLP